MRQSDRRMRRRVNKTLLLVGEGDSDVMFLRHIKRLYNSRDCGVSCTIRNACGRGPEHVLDYAIRQLKTGAFDTRVALIDTDLGWPRKMVKLAKQNGILLLGSDPCLEGLLLRILSQWVHDDLRDCRWCKQQIKAKRMDLLTPGCYEKHFPKNVLDDRRGDVPTLDRLIELLVGPGPRRQPMT